MLYIGLHYRPSLAAAAGVVRKRRRCGDGYDADIDVGPFFQTQPTMIQTQPTKAIWLLDPTQPNPP